MKRIMIISMILFIALFLIIFFIILKFKNLSNNNLNQGLEFVVTDFIKKNKSVKNCVISVMKGDGSFSWSGAAGIAFQDNRMSMKKDTPIYIASITKLYTATIIMILYEKGELSLDDPISKYLPKNLIQGIHVYNGKDYSNEITIKQLLSHTSGIADYYTEKPKGGKSVFEMLIEDPEHSWTVNEAIDRVRKDLKPKFIPGTDASYSDTNFQLLGKIIESIIGKELHTVFKEFIFDPLNLKNTNLVGSFVNKANDLSKPADVFYKNINITKIRSKEIYWADGGIISNSEEMIIFLKALNEGQIINKDTLKSMHDWHTIHQFPIQYGFGTMYFKIPHFMMKIPPLWGHSGSTGSFLYYSEDLNLYIAGSINQVKSKIESFYLMQDIIKAIEKNDII